MEIFGKEFRMKISSVLPQMTSFKGTVKMNRGKIAEQIYLCPDETKDSIIGNIKTLKNRLENETPYYKTFNLNFNYDYGRNRENSEIQHFGVISVEDETGRSLENYLLLGITASSARNSKNSVTDPQTIWEKGFKEITDKFVYCSYPKYVSQSDTKPLFVSRNTQKLIDEVDNDKDKLEKYDVELAQYSSAYKKKLMDIYNRIENRDASIIMDREKISKDINIAANHCSDEIKESLIGNINTLTKRLEEGKSPLKTYSIVTECNLNKDNCGGYNFFVTVNSEDDPHEFYSADLTLTDDYKHNYKCIVTGKDVWTKLFKPITDKLLWDGYTHQPFSRNPEKRNIYYQLQ